jgi:hypothetical protein
LILAVSSKGLAVGKKAYSSSSFDRRPAGEVPLNDVGNVIKGYAGIPDVVREDEDDRSFLMATSAGVLEYE